MTLQAALKYCKHFWLDLYVHNMYITYNQITFACIWQRVAHAVRLTCLSANLKANHLLSFTM